MEPVRIERTAHTLSSWFSRQGRDGIAPYAEFNDTLGKAFIAVAAYWLLEGPGEDAAFLQGLHCSCKGKDNLPFQGAGRPHLLGSRPGNTRTCCKQDLHADGLQFPIFVGFIMYQAAPPKKVAVPGLPADIEQREGQAHNGAVEQILSHLAAEAGIHTTVPVGDLTEEPYIMVGVLVFLPVHAQLPQERYAFLQPVPDEVLIRVSDGVPGKRNSSKGSPTR